MERRYDAAEGDTAAVWFQDREVVGVLAIAVGVGVEKTQ